jgi:uncharacterized protein YbjQ (UPF0145 family)
MTTTPPQQQQLAIPQVAQARLAHDAQPGAAATAFLSFPEYLTLRQMGLEPISTVVGLSVVHLGGIQVSGYKQAVELEAYSQAISLGVLSAAGRMQEEAATLGADGILLQYVEERGIGEEEHEYSWAGTALRFTPSPGGLRAAGGLPFVSNATVQTMYQMMRIGLAPVTYTMGVSVYHVPHRSLRQALGQTFRNTEVPVFTDAWYSAREIAMSRLQGQMERQGAQLVLQIKMQTNADVFGEHTAEFRFWGHGWRYVEGLARMIPAVDLSPDALIERGLLVTGSERFSPAPGAGGAAASSPPPETPQAPPPGPPPAG